MEISPFNIEEQNKSTDALITAAFERVSEAFRLLLWAQAKEHGLSPVQVQVLVFLMGHAEEKGTLSQLAKEFNITKATLSDVVRVLVEKKLLQKKDSPSDSRSQVLKLTALGKRVAGSTGSFANSIMQYISGFTQEQKIVLKDSLLVLIYNLYKDGIITMQRMCFTCVHYTSKNKVPFCGLLKILLVSENLRLDCPEHELKIPA